MFPLVRQMKPELFAASDPAVYVIGEQALRQELMGHGIRVINPDQQEYLGPNDSVSIDEFSRMKVDPTVVGVVVGTDYYLNHRNMCEASLYITENNAKVIGMNVDRSDGKDRLRPSGGSLIKLV